MENMKITIAHLYPQLLNLYSDRGNILTLCRRMEQRGIQTEVVQYDIDDDINLADTDILYLGGGTDREQQLVCEKLVQIRDAICDYAENGGCILATCGGFEMLGKNCGNTEGINLLDISTEYDENRLIGDVVLDSELVCSTVVGFENHSGRMNIGSYTPLGKIVYGNGNNGKDMQEGIVYKNVIGTYLHGPLLPKNPKLADYIIKCAVDKKYGDDIQLTPLDDEAEINAHNYIVEKYK